MPAPLAEAVAIRGEENRVTRVTEKVPLSRHHRKIQFGRSKAMMVVAAGALSVAAASATAATWNRQTPAHPGAGGTGETTGALRLLVADELIKPRAAGARRAVARARTSSRQEAAASGTASGTPRHIAKEMLRSFGWPAGQFSCLEPLWAHESGWSVTAHNPGSGAYGIPQAMPGSKMASAGADWQHSAATQIRWGLKYIRGLYGSPCGAWNHELATGWY
jgi:hypothetical protein